MTREDLNKNWEFIEAFKNGKEIEFQHVVTKCWMDAIDPSFNECVEYRLKEEPKYVPFDFSDAEKLIGKAVKFDHSELVQLITSVQKHHVYLDRWTKFKDLFENFTFLDGSKCGKLC
jgi:hypothetical protein